MRGRRVGGSLQDYVNLCAHGEDRVAEALIARHTLRMDRIRLTPDYERLPILDALASASLLDLLLYRSSGANPARPPQAYWGSWPDRLAWGVDSCVAATRLLLCGQVLGAAVVARTQLERWTYLRAEVARLRQEPGEDTADYIARVWSTKDEFDENVLNMDTDAELAPSVRTAIEDVDVAPHDHIITTDGSEICPAMLWMTLSEMIHGRYLSEAIAWDATAMLASQRWTDEYTVAVGTVCESIRLCLRQLRLTCADLAEKAGDHSAVVLLLSAQDGFSAADGDDGQEAMIQTTKALWRKRTGAGPNAQVPETILPRKENRPTPQRSPSAIMFTGLTAPPLEALLPLLPHEGLGPGPVETVRGFGRLFVRVMAGEFPAGRKYRDDELTTIAFGWHRERHIRWAIRALERERELRGRDFKIEGLTGRAVAWCLATEAASISAGWFTVPEMRDAAHLMGTGLRSASWLWLEDDDRAMSVLRAVLEQCARLRTWRLKPEKAARIESEGVRTTPRDWLEAAGWRRLRALNRALGEFAHALPRSDWSGARELLSMLQGDRVDPEEAIYTARGAALEFVTQLVTDEITATVRELSPVLADNLTIIFANVGIDLPLNAERRFNHIWNHRSTNSVGIREFATAPGVPAAGGALVRPQTPTGLVEPNVARWSVLGLVAANPRDPKRIRRSAQTAEHTDN